MNTPPLARSLLGVLSRATLVGCIKPPPSRVGVRSSDLEALALLAVSAEAHGGGQRLATVEQIVVHPIDREGRRWRATSLQVRQNN